MRSSSFSTSQNPSPVAAPTNPPFRHKPVSSALIVPGGLYGARVRRALEIVDAIHDDGTLPVLPVIATRGIMRAGMYVSREGEETGLWTPVRLELSRSATNFEFTLYHEIGHLLDEQLLGSGKELGSDDVNNIELMVWRTAITRSRAIMYLKQMRTRKRAELFDETSQVYSVNLDPTELTLLNYYLQRHEIFARAYAQYIVTRSGDPHLLSQLDSERQKLPAHIYFAIQWTDDDFEPIVEAFDRIFTGRGWR